MNTRRLLKTSRPRFWIYSIGPYLLGIAAAMRPHHYQVWSAVPVIVFFLFFTFPANIFTYGVNDIFDYETDRLNPKKVEYESLVMPSERAGLWKIIALVCVPVLVYSCIAFPIAVTASVAFFFVCAASYSVPPIRAKARPVLDSIVSGLHYVSPGIVGYILGISLSGMPFSHASFGLCLASGFLWSAAMHAFSAVPDVEADKKAGLATIATILGEKRTVLLCTLLYALSTIILLPFLGALGVLLGAIYISTMAYSFGKNAQKTFAIYTRFPLINTLAGMAVTLFILIR